MTLTLKFSRANDILGAGLSISPPPVLADVVGSWFNTNPTTGEIARLTVSERKGGLLLNIEGAGRDRSHHVARNLRNPLCCNPRFP